MAYNISDFKIRIFFITKPVDLALRLVWFVFTLQLATSFSLSKKYFYLTVIPQYLDYTGLHLFYSPQILAFILDCYEPEHKIYVNKILV